MSELGETNGKKCPLVAKNVKIFKMGSANHRVTRWSLNQNNFIYISEISKVNCVRKAAKPLKNQNV